MSFNKWLNSNKVILFDGGMGSELFKHGLEFGKLPDLFNLEKPDLIREVHKNYYNAGSDMVQTCTFSSNLVNLERNNLSNKLEILNSEALKNIKAVRPNNKLIVGDIGPSGEFRPPVGQAKADQWKNGFQKQAEILESGIDLWHIETMSDIIEMQAAIQAIKEISKKPIITSMTYRKTRRGFFTIMGDSVESCVNTLENEGVAVIGANCTIISNEMIDLTKTLIKLTNRPVSVKPNAGQPRLEGGRTVYDQAPEDFVKDIQQMIEAGAKVVGGCCGTSSIHIQLLRKLLDSS
ncbi:MAG: homocysteine S-methyltransferase family protein [Candidatus Hodarchaeales archaeon]